MEDFTTLTNGSSSTAFLVISSSVVGKCANGCLLKIWFQSFNDFTVGYDIFYDIFTHTHKRNGTYFFTIYQIPNLLQYLSAFVGILHSYWGPPVPGSLPSTRRHISCKLPGVCMVCIEHQAGHPYKPHTPVFCPPCTLLKKEKWKDRAFFTILWFPVLTIHSYRCCWTK